MAVKLYKSGKVRRQVRVRSALKGTAQRPRLSVFRSNKYIYAELIDDRAGATLVSASDRGIKIKPEDKIGRAAEVGGLLASEATKKGIKEVIFDRGSYRYHGRVKALAEGARKGGLKF